MLQHRNSINTKFRRIPPDLCDDKLNPPTPMDLPITGDADEGFLVLRTALIVDVGVRHPNPLHYFLPTKNCFHSSLHQYNTVLKCTTKKTCLVKLESLVSPVVSPEHL